MARRLDLHDWDDLPGTRDCGPGWAMVLGNSLEVLEKMPPRSVDLIFADPPYHLSNGGTTCQGGRRVRVDKGGWDQSHGVEADHAFQSAWLQACSHSRWKAWSASTPRDWSQSPLSTRTRRPPWQVVPPFDRW